MTERKYTNEKLAEDYYTSKENEFLDDLALKNCEKVAEKIKNCEVNIAENYKCNKGKLIGLKNFEIDTKNYLEEILSKKVSYVREDGVIVLPEHYPGEKKRMYSGWFRGRRSRMRRLK